MKRTKMLSALALSCVLAGSLCLFAGCGPSDDPGDDKDGPVLNFVATDSTNWDASVTFAEKAYNLSMDLNADNTLALVGTCTGEAQQGGGGSGGPGGSDSGGSEEEEGGEEEGPGGGEEGPGGEGGFPGGGEEGPGGEGGFPGGEGAPFGVTTFAAADEGEAEEGDTTTDFSAYNFTIKGTWSEEKGWGYTLTMEDASKTVIHVNFDKTSGRHYFYYYAAPTIDGTAAEETLVRMEAKDSDYRKTLDPNYAIYEERECTYMFRGGQEGGSGNLSSAYIYLMPDGSVISLSGTSNNRSYSAKGSWSEDKANHVITMDVNGTACTTDAYCDIAGKEGYRMQYTAASSGPFGGSSAMTLYASCDPSKFTWDKYTSTDFEGEDILVMDGGDYELRLTEKGYARVVKTGTTTASFTGTYTKDAAGNYSITTKYGTYTSVKSGSTITMELHIPVKGSGPFASEVETVLNFTAQA